MLFFSRKNRAKHLGRYPMEWIKRVDQPTTLITENIKRVAKRADFFVRAFHQDLGPKPGREIRRFIMKQPLNKAIGHLHWKHVPVHRGEVAKEIAPLPKDVEVVSRHIKSLCYFMDADMVGICEMPEWAWYSHDGMGKPIEAKHKYAIVIVIDQGWDTFEGSTGDDWISGAQSYRAYLNGSTTAVVVADYIRRLGYPAQAHSNADGEVLQIPLMLLAGLGELSRIGELVLNPFIGPRHKTAVVTTDLPLVPDKPIDFGLQDFCSKCRKCARECPVQAIPFGDKVLYNGYEIWKPDVVKCTSYRTTNPQGSACSRCMKICPFNKEGLLTHWVALWMAIKLPFSRSFLIWLDDVLGYGIPNPIKKWWFDLEIVNGSVQKAKKTSNKGLNSTRNIPEDNNSIAIFPPETHPLPENSNSHVPDRKVGKKDTKLAERKLKELYENL